MNSKIFNLIKTIDNSCELVEHHNQHTIIIKNKSKINPVLNELKKNTDTAFDMLLDITAIDWNRSEKRFEIVYFLYSNSTKSRLRVKTTIEENDCNIPTAEKIYPSANWYEREVWDMYGIKFPGHTDMRRFYMPEDFYNKETGETYHPLRKDFPLTGIPNSLPLPPYPERYGNEVEY